jgi:hypothetical protein
VCIGFRGPCSGRAACPRGAGVRLEGGSEAVADDGVGGGDGGWMYVHAWGVQVYVGKVGVDELVCSCHIYGG